MFRKLLRNRSESISPLLLEFQIFDENNDKSRSDPGKDKRKGKEGQRMYGSSDDLISFITRLIIVSKLRNISQFVSLSVC